MRTRAAAALIALMLAAWAWPAPAQGLGDAARRERERRDKLKAEGKAGNTTVDESALKANKGQLANDAPAAAPSEPTGADATPEPAVAASPAGRDADVRRQEEASWRRRMQVARANVASAQERYDFLNNQHLAPTTYIVDERTGKMLTADLLQRWVADAKSELEAAQKSLEELEERARRERVPPGWLR